MFLLVSHCGWEKGSFYSFLKLPWLLFSLAELAGPNLVHVGAS